MISRYLEFDRVSLIKRQLAITCRNTLSLCGLFLGHYSMLLIKVYNSNQIISHAVMLYLGLRLWMTNTESWFKTRCLLSSVFIKVASTVIVLKFIIPTRWVNSHALMLYFGLRLWMTNTESWFKTRCLLSSVLIKVTSTVISFIKLCLAMWTL